MNSIYTNVSDLPSMIQSALCSVGYGRKDIQVETRESVSPLGGGGGGIRDFVCIVDLNTGTHKKEYGSWGGPNPWSAKRIDNDRNEYTIPPNVCVLKGHEGGGRPVYCTLIVRPDMVVPWLPAPKTLTKRQQFIIDVLKKYNPRGRKENFNRGSRVPPSDAEMQTLQGMGLVKINKAGAVSLTVEGKNAVSKGWREEYADPE